MSENVALFDMDGTLCDYESHLLKSLDELRSPDEPKSTSVPQDNAPAWLRARADMIRSSVEWWSDIPIFQLGMTIYQMAVAIGYKPMILTQGPKRNPSAWMGKKIWIDKNIGRDVDITITRDKGLVYGRVLVDDWPAYILRWLHWRPRSMVIMPAAEHNKDFKHPQVFRYAGLADSAGAINILENRFKR